MPVHDTVAFGHVDHHQPTAARTANAMTGLRAVHGTVGGTHQPLAAAVKKSVGLVVHFHGYVGALVQIAIDLALEADGKAARGSPAVHHIKGHGFTAVHQIGRIAQGDGWAGGHLGHSVVLCISGMGSKPCPQFGNGMGDKKWLQFSKRGWFVRTIADTNAGAARI